MEEEVTKYIIDEIFDMVYTRLYSRNYYREKMKDPEYVKSERERNKQRMRDIKNNDPEKHERIRANQRKNDRIRLKSKLDPCEPKIHPSPFERKVKKIVYDSINYLGEIKENYFHEKIINPNTNRQLEFDIWFKDVDIGIECQDLCHLYSKDTKERDDIKRQKCRENNIDLIEIIYTEKNILEFLKIELEGIYMRRLFKE